MAKLPTALYTLMSLATCCCYAALDIHNTTMIYDWNEVTPSNGITWQPCFDNFTCTRLNVPFDYENPNVGTIAVAFIKYAAPAPSQSTRDILFNPGGPGGSGVQQVMSSYSRFVQTFGSEHNFIGFDPRGVLNTGPWLSCFPDDPSVVTTLNALLREPVFDQSLETGIDQYYLGEAFSQWCNREIGGPNETAKYASTPAVARDMLTFIEAQNEANGLPPESAQLWYVGYSYGTLLGATFAALYPDRIGRMILDGVVDSEDYYSGQRANNLVDADAAVETFFSTCYQAGPQKCAFYANSTSAIADRLTRLEESLRSAPIPVFDQAVTTIPRIATYSTFKQLFFQALYDPIPNYVPPASPGWPGLASILVELEQRNATSLMKLTPRLTAPCPSSNQSSPKPYDGVEASVLIECMDAFGLEGFKTFDDYAAYALELKNQSHWVGTVWALKRLLCGFLEIEPPADQEWKGPLPLSANSTSFPILWVSNTIDPVTPLAAAYRMAAAFPGSVVVRQSAVGHTTLAAPSMCLNGVKQAYLRGQIPGPNITCATDLGPFGITIS